MKERFESRRLTGSIKIKLTELKVWVAQKAAVCASIMKVIQQFTAKGYTLTLRQLYYQLVAADLIPNHDKVYKKIGRILDDLRYSGNIDWSSIEDRGRVPKIPYKYDGVADAINDAVRTYRIDRQEGQKINVEVWTEKDAVSGILYRVTSRYHIRLVVNKGYSSSTAMYRAYRRFINHITEGRKVLILYLGDHDPSGLDMVRDIRQRIETFLCQGDELDSCEVEDFWDEFDIRNADYVDDESRFDRLFELIEKRQSVAGLNDGEEHDLEGLFYQMQRFCFLREKDLFEVRHIGLTKEQIEEFNPPPNPAKMTDSRSAEYVQEHGPVSWELDALDPSIMETIVDEAIQDAIDMDLYKQVVEREKAEKQQLSDIADKLEAEGDDEDE